jgi:DNA primase
MSIWNDIKDRLSIEDILSDYVSLKSKGVNYTCICPFHNEKSPSLIISTEKQIWHCFGCGVGGDIFAFVSQIENIDKKEALEKLAKKANIELPKLGKEKVQNPSRQTSNTNTDNSESQHTKDESASNSSSGYQLLDWAANLYHQYLLKALENPTHPISQYCHQRGLTLEIIKKFKLGFAPHNNIITNLLANKPGQLALARDIGLIKEIEQKY